MKTIGGTDKSSYKGIHCNKIGHIKSHCYELVGYPKWWDHNRDQRKNNSKRTSIVTIVETKTDDDVTKTTSALVTITNSRGIVLNISAPVSNSTWITNSGAMYHMIFDSRHILHLKRFSHKKVSTANGNTTQISGEGFIALIDTLNLEFVLIVPSLDYNLISISQLTEALSCVVIFWPNFYMFKDI